MTKQKNMCEPSATVRELHAGKRTKKRGKKRGKQLGRLRRKMGKVMWEKGGEYICNWDQVKEEKGKKWPDMMENGES